MRYLLDTNIVIALSKQVPPVVDRLGHCLASDILLSTVVLAEIEYGIAKSVRQALSLDVTLVTDNTGEFSRVAGLRLENWLRTP